MISIRNLVKVYDSPEGKFEALRDVNITIDDEDIYGIIGLSGAGKSSLLRCINMLERPTSGSVEIDGVEMTRLDESQIREKRKQIGMIFQHFNLLMNSTVFDNIAFPMKIAKRGKAEIQKRVEELLEIVGLSQKALSYPAQLSGGEKQRVGIARALANSPDLLLCDEATSALDPSTTDSILSLLERINKDLGITIVIITHEMDVVRRVCKRVAVLEKGMVAEERFVKDVVAAPMSETAKRFLEVSPDVRTERAV